jgi:hypothetical protein
MKKYFFILFGFFLTCSVLHAQIKRHGILANIGTIIVGNYEVYYDHRLNKNFSLSTTAIFYEGSSAIWRVYSHGYHIALGILPKLHIYGKSHKNSFYLAPSLKMGYIEHPARIASEKTDRGLLSRFGVNFGFQHVFKSGLMIDLLAGLEHYHTFSFTKPKTRYQSETRVLIRPVMSASIGYAF